LALKPKASLLKWGWWLALHVLLAVAALLTAWPWPIRLAATLTVLGHGAARRPRPSPGLILIGADAHCAVPDWYPGRLALGPRTVVCPYWIRLDLGTGLEQRDIVLCIDQLRPDEWARLCGLLDRARRP
jgi:hypothetical protein